MGVAMAFEITESTPKKQRDILAKRDKVIKSAQEREEELRRRKFDHEEQKRLQEKKSREIDVLNRDLGTRNRTSKIRHRY